MSPKRRQKIARRPLDINENTISNLETCRGNRYWERRQTQRDLFCYYHKQFEQFPEHNYHVSVWNRKRPGDNHVDHHATLYLETNGEKKKIHYGFCRSNERIVWVDEVDRTDPKQLKVIQLFEMFESDKQDLLPQELVKRLNVPKA